MDTDFQSFRSISRLSREIILTEKLDGTNAVIFIGENGEFLTGSRSKWITPEDDNHGFSKWAHENKEELMKLGPGRHFGEWWGLGINRNYGIKEKRFSLFNTFRWGKETSPTCCSVVPVIGVHESFDTNFIDRIFSALKETGSIAAPGFMNPEGIVIYHKQGNILFKKTFEKDKEGKGK